MSNKTLLEIRELATWPENWNSYCALPPNPLAVEYAYRWFLHISSLGLSLLEPLVSADGEGNVFFGWRNSHRYLDIYVEPETICFLKFELDKDMGDGEISTLQEFQELWAWLMG